MKKDTLQNESFFIKLLLYRINNYYTLFIFWFLGSVTLEFAIPLR